MRDDRGRGGVTAFRAGQKDPRVEREKILGDHYFSRLLFFIAENRCSMSHLGLVHLPHVAQGYQRHLLGTIRRLSDQFCDLVKQLPKPTTPAMVAVDLLA